MNTSALTRVLIATFGLLAGYGNTALAAPPALAAEPEAARKAYVTMVRRVANMPENGRAISIVERHRLSILNVLWEDTGRWEGSSMGPNISDVTIEVEMKNRRGRSSTALMPVIRYPNFTDKTGDVDMDKLWLPVGNHSRNPKDDKKAPLTYITLRDFLTDPTRYMTLPDRGKVKGGSLLARRDSHVLVSAQATFLPIPQDGEATFWPVIFNYQSSRRNPAVLTLLVTRQGTSMTIIDNTRDSLGGSWGQRLFFNAGGERTPLTAERLSTVQATGVTANGEAASSLGADANLLMIIQVPLRFREPRRNKAMASDSALGGPPSAPSAAGGAPAASKSANRTAASDVETAVLGHGPELGPYIELDGLTVARDARFPVRVTVQFYQATSNGVIDSDDVKALAAQIKEVYTRADYVGSLVVPSGADRRRPTRWDGTGPMPPGTVLQPTPRRAGIE